MIESEVATCTVLTNLSARNEINGWSTSNFDGDNSGELVDETQLS